MFGRKGKIKELPVFVPKADPSTFFGRVIGRGAIENVQSGRWTVEDAMNVLEFQFHGSSNEVSRERWRTMYREVQRPDVNVYASVTRRYIEFYVEPIEAETEVRIPTPEDYGQPQYQVGDIVNGHQLTWDGIEYRWIPVAA
jgi:hypothetical protein